jgi:hypothetical protein
VFLGWLIQVRCDLVKFSLGKSGLIRLRLIVV